MLKTILKTKTNKQTNKKPERQNPRTNGKNKAIQTKSQKEAFTYTLRKREKKIIFIYIKKREQPNQ